tara:strand:+ start:228 stop:581 length:354 start_codon:yes stop_codon:yes gene_type:complete
MEVPRQVTRWLVAAGEAYNCALRSAEYKPATTLCAGSSGTFDVSKLRQRHDARTEGIFVLGSTATSYNARQVYAAISRGNVETVVHDNALNVPDGSAFHLQYSDFLEVFAAMTRVLP